MSVSSRGGAALCHAGDRVLLEPALPVIARLSGPAPVTRFFLVSAMSHEAGQCSAFGQTFQFGSSISLFGQCLLPVTRWRLAGLDELWDLGPPLLPLGGREPAVMAVPFAAFASAVIASEIPTGCDRFNGLGGQAREVGYVATTGDAVVEGDLEPLGRGPGLGMASYRDLFPEETVMLDAAKGPVTL